MAMMKELSKDDTKEETPQSNHEARRADQIDRYIGRRLRMRRIEKGLSLNDISDALGISYQQIQKYENGTNRISVGRLYALSAIVDVPISYFYEGLPSAHQFLKDNTLNIGKDVPGLATLPTTNVRDAIIGLIDAINKSDNK